MASRTWRKLAIPGRILFMQAPWKRLTIFSRHATLHGMRKGPQNETVVAPGLDLDRQARSATLPFARAAAEGGVGGVPCVTLGRVPLAMDTLTWRMGPSLRLTVVIKTQFSLDPLSAQEPDGA